MLSVAAFNPKASSTGLSRSREFDSRQPAATSNTLLDTISDRLGVAIVSLSQHDGFKLRYRPVKDVVDENIAVIRDNSQFPCWLRSSRR